MLLEIYGKNCPIIAVHIELTITKTDVPRSAYTGTVRTAILHYIRHRAYLISPIPSAIGNSIYINTPFIFC